MFTDPKKNVLEFGFIPGQKVVDLGSGSGHYSQALSLVLGPMGRVVAIDLEKDMLVKLKNELSGTTRDNIEILDGNVEKPQGTKLRDGYADGVVFSNILYQLGDIPSAIIEAKRILKPGGKACVVEWKDLKLVSGRDMSGGRQAIPEVDTRKFFEKAGFIFEKSFPAGESHYGLILKKPLQ